MRRGGVGIRDVHRLVQIRLGDCHVAVAGHFQRIAGDCRVILILGNGIGAPRQVVEGDGAARLHGHKHLGGTRGAVQVIPQIVLLDGHLEVGLFNGLASLGLGDLQAALLLGIDIRQGNRLGFIRHDSFALAARRRCRCIQSIAVDIRAGLGEGDLCIDRHVIDLPIVRIVSRTRAAGFVGYGEHITIVIVRDLEALGQRRRAAEDLLHHHGASFDLLAVDELNVANAIDRSGVSQQGFDRRGAVGVCGLLRRKLIVSGIRSAVLLTDIDLHLGNIHRLVVFAGVRLCGNHFINLEVMDAIVILIREVDQRELSDVGAAAGHFKSFTLRQHPLAIAEFFHPEGIGIRRRNQAAVVLTIVLTRLEIRVRAIVMAVVAIEMPLSLRDHRTASEDPASAVLLLEADRIGREEQAGGIGNIHGRSIICIERDVLKDVLIDVLVVCVDAAVLVLCICGTFYLVLNNGCSVIPKYCNFELSDPHAGAGHVEHNALVFLLVDLPAVLAHAAQDVRAIHIDGAAIGEHGCVQRIRRQGFRLDGGLARQAGRLAPSRADHAVYNIGNLTRRFRDDIEIVLQAILDDLAAIVISLRDKGIHVHHGIAGELQLAAIVDAAHIEGDVVQAAAADIDVGIGLQGVDGKVGLGMAGLLIAVRHNAILRGSAQDAFGGQRAAKVHLGQNHIVRDGRDRRSFRAGILLRAGLGIAHLIVVIPDLDRESLGKFLAILDQSDGELLVAADGRIRASSVPFALTGGLVLNDRRHGSITRQRALIGIRARGGMLRRHLQGNAIISSDRHGNGRVTVLDGDLVNLLVGVVQADIRRQRRDILILVLGLGGHIVPEVEAGNRIIGIAIDLCETGGDRTVRLHLVEAHIRGIDAGNILHGLARNIIAGSIDHLILCVRGKRRQLITASGVHDAGKIRCPHDLIADNLVVLHKAHAEEILALSWERFALRKRSISVGIALLLEERHIDGVRHAIIRHLLQGREDTVMFTIDRIRVGIEIRQDIRILRIDRAAIIQQEIRQRRAVIRLHHLRGQRLRAHVVMLYLTGSVITGCLIEGLNRDIIRQRICAAVVDVLQRIEDALLAGDRNEQLIAGRGVARRNRVIVRTDELSVERHLGQRRQLDRGDIANAGDGDQLAVDNAAIAIFHTVLLDDDAHGVTTGIVVLIALNVLFAEIRNDNGRGSAADGHTGLLMNVLFVRGLSDLRNDGTTIQFSGFAVKIDAELGPFRQGDGTVINAGNLVSSDLVRRLKLRIRNIADFALKILRDVVLVPCEVHKQDFCIGGILDGVLISDGTVFKIIKRQLPVALLAADDIFNLFLGYRQRLIVAIPENDQRIIFLGNTIRIGDCRVVIINKLHSDLGIVRAFIPVNRHSHNAQAVHLELHLVGGAVQVDGGVAGIDVDIILGDVGGFRGGIHGFAHVGIQGQVDDLDVGGRLGAQLVRNLVALEFHFNADAAGLGLELHLLRGGHAQLVLLIDHEGEVVQQGVFRGVFLLGGLRVQGIHIGVIVITAGVVGDLPDDKLGVIRHVAGTAHPHLGMDVAVLILIEALGELLFKAHHQPGVRSERLGRVAGGDHPGTVCIAVGEPLQLCTVQGGLDIIVTIEVHGASLGQVIVAVIQRLVNGAQDDGGLFGVVIGRICNGYVGIIRAHGDIGLRGEGLVAPDSGDHRAVCAGFTGSPAEGAVGFALGDGRAAFIINGKAHPLGAGGSKCKFDILAREHIDRAGGKSAEFEDCLFFLLGFRFRRFLLGGRFLDRLLSRGFGHFGSGVLGRLIPDFGLVFILNPDFGLVFSLGLVALHFRLLGLGFGLFVLGFRLLGLGLGFLGFGFRLLGLGFGLVGLHFRFPGLGFRLIDLDLRRIRLGLGVLCLGLFAVFVVLRGGRSSLFGLLRLVRRRLGGSLIFIFRLVLGGIRVRT